MDSLPGKVPPAYERDWRALNELVDSIAANPEAEDSFAKTLLIERTARDMLARWGNVPGDKAWRARMARLRKLNRDGSRMIDQRFTYELYPLIKIAKRGRPAKNPLTRTRGGRLFEEAWAEFRTVWQHRASESVRERLLTSNREQLEKWGMEVFRSVVMAAFSDFPKKPSRKKG